MSGLRLANTAKSVGDYAIPTDPLMMPYVYKCTEAGTTHTSTEPTGPTTPSATVLITSASTNGFSTAGRKENSGTGAATGIRAMSGRSRSRPRTICTRR